MKLESLQLRGRLVGGKCANARVWGRYLFYEQLVMYGTNGFFVEMDKRFVTCGIRKMQRDSFKSNSLFKIIH